MEHLVDLHCHILPGIDDGAKTPEESLSLLKKQLEDGVVGIVFTPHFNYERTTVEQFAQNRKRAMAQVGALVKAQGFHIAAKLGSEVYFTPVLPTLDLKKLAFANSHYLLMELPTSFHPSGVEETLFAIQQQGYTPILAHVERYPYVTEDPTLLYRWVSGGALAQINAAGLIRGGQTTKLLQRYMDWGLVHLLCTDAHNMGRRAPNLREAYDTLDEKTAAQFHRNSVEVYLGNELHPPEPIEPKFRFGHWV